MTLEDESAPWEGVQYATGKEQRAITDEMKQLGQIANDAQLWICLGVKVEFDAAKKNSA